MSYPPPYNPNYGQQPPPPGQSAYPGAPPPAGWAAPNPGYQPPPQGNMGMGYAPPPAPPHMAGGYGGAPGADVEWGGQGPKNSNLGFSSTTIRQGFIRKVFMILSCQLAFVAALVGLFVFEHRVQQFVLTNKWLFHLSYVTFLVTYIVLVCCESVRRRFPGNIIALIVMTGSLGFVTATIASTYNVKVVFIALAVTVISCAAVIIFAMQTKYDFTGWIAVMFMLSIGLFLFGMIIIIFATAFKSSEIKVIWIVYCGLATLLFLVYLAIDVQLVIGGKRYELSPEEYILAATQLFIDIVYIFLYLLQIVGFASK